MTTLGINTISDLRLGDSQVQAAYLGDQLMWSHEAPPSSDYWGLCFTAEEPNAFVGMTGNGSPPSLNLLYSTDSQTWNTFTPGTTTVTLANVGDKVWLKAGSGGNAGTASSSSSSDYWSFSFTNHVAASGNIMSLLNGEQQTYVISQDQAFYRLFINCTSLTQAPELPATTLSRKCYGNMFTTCTSLSTPPALPATTIAIECYQNMFPDCSSLTAAPALPATTLASNCYYNMFWGCTSLSIIQELPATTLANNCYTSMFRDCTSLTAAPELPATELSNYCYRYMFAGCTSLTQAPALSATTLAMGCYGNMFAGCTSLSSISASFTTWNTSSATTNWVNNVASNGTFYCPTALGTNATITRGSSNCPTNWTVVNTDA